MVFMIKQGIYKHSKSGNLYKVHFVAKHSETLEDMVVYEALYDNPKSRFWVRPVSMFEEIVDIEVLNPLGSSEVQKVPRFTFQSDSI